MTIDQRELDFRAKVHLMISFPYEMRKSFIEYWSEPNKNNTKMRFELEKTWDLNRRLLRWQRSSKENNHIGQPVAKEVAKIDIPEVVELDRLLYNYQKHPTEIPFSEMGKYFDYMKAENLLKPFTPAEAQGILKTYHGDKQKCRCYCVEETLKAYTNTGLTFSDIMRTKLRQPV